MLLSLSVANRYTMLGPANRVCPKSTRKNRFTSAG